MTGDGKLGFEFLLHECFTYYVRLNRYTIQAYYFLEGLHMKKIRFFLNCMWLHT